MEFAFSPYPYPQDWHNNHYDRRTVWLANPWPEENRRRAGTFRGRLLASIASIAGFVGSLPPEWRPKRRGTKARA